MTTPSAFDAVAEMKLTLVDHDIACVISPGDSVQGNLMLSRGALIQGEVVGDISCAKGSVIVTASGVVRGSITADRIYVEGSVGSAFEGQSPPRLVAPEIILVSSTAQVQADLYSNAFSIHSTQLQGQVGAYQDSLAHTG